MRVLVSGAGGLVGSALCPALAAAGHDVVALVRHSARNERELQWEFRDAGPAVFGGGGHAAPDFDAIIHLAGERIDQRWTPASKRRILESRVNGTRALAEAVAERAQRTPHPPALICASAVGFYGDTGSALADDDTTPQGSGFLAEVVAAWERAAGPAREAGARVVHLRLGVVLAAHGGALARMLLPFKLGLGGRLGSGKQWLSWITLNDAVRGFVHALESETLAGSVNLTSPSPVTNAEFTRTLARALHRPSLFPVPALALKALFGDMAEETLLVGQRAVPSTLSQTGFVFEATALEPGLRAALTRQR